MYLEMIVIRRVRLHVIRYLPYTVLVAVDTLFPDLADRFLDVRDAV